MLEESGVNGKMVAFEERLNSMEAVSAGCVALHANEAMAGYLKTLPIHTRDG
jgi:hypothetical protein